MINCFPSTTELVVAHYRGSVFEREEKVTYALLYAFPPSEAVLKKQVLPLVAHLLCYLLHLHCTDSPLSSMFSEVYFTCQFFPVIWLHWFKLKTWSFTLSLRWQPMITQQYSGSERYGTTPADYFHG